MDQLMIFLTGVTAIVLSQHVDFTVRRWASVLGLAGQPFWLYATLQADQYGMLFLSVAYTVAWTYGFYTHWYKPFTEGKI